MSHKEGPAFGTIHGYLSALRRYETDLGTLNPLCSPSFTTLMEGIKITKGITPRDEEEEEKRPGFTSEHLQAMLQYMPPFERRSYSEKLLLATVSTALAGLLRANELLFTGPLQRVEARPQVGDLIFCTTEAPAPSVKAHKLDVPKCTHQFHHCELRIKCSKTDKYKRGDWAVFGEETAKVLSQYMCVHPLRHDSNALLFVNSEGLPYTRTQLMQDLRSALRAAGVPELLANRFSGHSFRIGGAEDGEEYGDEFVKLIGRWVSITHLHYHGRQKAKVDAANVLEGRRRRRFVVGGLGGPSSTVSSSSSAADPR